MSHVFLYECKLRSEPKKIAYYELSTEGQVGSDEIVLRRPLGMYGDVDSLEASLYEMWVRDNRAEIEVAFQAALGGAPEQDRRIHIPQAVVEEREKLLEEAAKEGGKIRAWFAIPLILALAAFLYLFGEPLLRKFAM